MAGRRCVYCGAYTHGSRYACRCHVDLLKLDPRYNPALRQSTEPRAA